MGKQYDSDNAMPDPGTYGGCRYCGQIYRMSDAPLDETTAVERATMQCDCTEAKIYQNKVRRKGRIKAKLYQDYGKEGAEVCKLSDGLYGLLLQAADLVSELEIEKCSIHVNDVSKIDISMKKDMIKVKMTQKREATSEA